MSGPPLLRLLLFAMLASTLSCGGGGGGGNGGGGGGVPVQKIPNLRPEKAYDLSIENTNTGTTVERVLRVASKVSNYGNGPMELFGEISGAPQGELVTAFQIIRWSNGDVTQLPAGHFEYHPVHSHWHWENLVNFRLLATVNPDDPYDVANTELGSNPKVSFCLVDSTKISPWNGPPRPGSAQYRQCHENTQGISNGWSDIYAASLYGQWIVIEGVPDGIYWVVFETDPESLLQETDETDNRSAVKIQITGNTVAVLP